jgi:ABC-type spermidine/putrescine transport system permease subunit II
LAEALSGRQVRIATWLGAGLLLVLLARPWWQPEQYRMLVGGDAVCAAAMLAGLPLAWALWAGGTAVRGLSAGCLVALAIAAPPLAGVALVALPGLAALNRMPPAVLDEARAGGAGWVRIAIQLVLPAAAPGLVYGGLLCLAPGGYWRLVAAALPLVLR